ncbi:MAG: hypothetical protein AB1403_24370, partial [Candidatus Riflebacteria bacterium]
DFIRSFDFATLATLAGNAFNSLFDAIDENFSFVFDNIDSIYQRFISGAKNAAAYIAQVFNGVKSLIQKLNPENLFSGLVAFMGDAYKLMTAGFTGFAEGTIFVIKKVATLFYDVVEGAIEAFQSFLESSPRISSAFGIEPASLSDFISKIKSAQQSADNVLTSFQGAFSTIRNVSESIPSDVFKDFNQKLEGLKIDVNNPLSAGLSLPKLQLDFDPGTLATSLNDKIQNEVTVKVNTSNPQNQAVISGLSGDMQGLVFAFIDFLKNQLASQAAGEGAPIVALA